MKKDTSSLCPTGKKLTTHAELHARWMKDPEYRKAYEEETERERLTEEAKNKKGV